MKKLLFALIFSFKNSKLIWVYPLFTLALLCKFQAIVLIPLLAGLTLRNYKEYKQHLTGIAISALIFCLGFLPFILQGQFIPAMERAYWGNLGMYQFSSMNAANLWYLLTNGSMHSDKIVLFGARVAESGFDLWLTPAKLGLIFYVFSSALITFFAFKK